MMELSEESAWFLFATMLGTELQKSKAELDSWRSMVKKVSEEKEMVEEKFSEMQQQSRSTLEQASALRSLGEENERVMELENARRALMQVTNRTLESKSLRAQISTVVKENERLARELDDAAATAKRLQLQCNTQEVELEIWRERKEKK